MSDVVLLLSVPGLREEDLSRMPNLRRLTDAGDLADLVPSFPGVTWPVQANMLTGELPTQHGVIANGFYWRESHDVEMWTAWNEKIQQPQIWDILHRFDAELTSAVWFPMLSKGCGADYVCMPAPVHNPDGSESLWCYTKPQEFYGELLEKFEHFPLKHFWGPLANIKSTSWIAETGAHAAATFQPRFFYFYLPHLDYAAQRDGPHSPKALEACGELDQVIGKLAGSLTEAYRGQRVLWLVGSEYTIVPVDSVCYPNRILRQAGLLDTRPDEEGKELIDFASSKAWALVDHQFSHVFCADPNDASRVVDLFRNAPEIAEVLHGSERVRYAMDHERSGEVILISQPNSWQAYYWWEDDQKAPAFAHSVDIHRKPGYDPVELHFDFATKSTPLDATLVKGSHGAPATHESQRGVLLSSQKGVFVEQPLADTDVCEIVLRQFGI